MFDVVKVIYCCTEQRIVYECKCCYYYTSLYHQNNLKIKSVHTDNKFTHNKIAEILHFFSGVRDKFNCQSAFIYNILYRKKKVGMQNYDRKIFSFSAKQ